MRSYEITSWLGIADTFPSLTFIFYLGVHSVPFLFDVFVIKLISIHSGSYITVKDRQPVKSLVIGRPILLALEEIDGTPSFLEKALRFVEAHGELLVLFH